MKKLFLLAVFLLSFTIVRSAPAQIVVRTNQVNLVWDASCDTNTVGYNVRYGVTNSPPSTNIVAAYTTDCGLPVPASTNIYAGKYTNTVFVAGLANNGIGFTGLALSNTYAFTVTITNRQGLESPLSTEVLVYLISGPKTNTLPSAVQGFFIRSITNP